MASRMGHGPRHGIVLGLVILASMAMSPAGSKLTASMATQIGWSSPLTRSAPNSPQAPALAARTTRRNAESNQAQPSPTHHGLSAPLVILHILLLAGIAGISTRFNRVP